VQRQRLDTGLTKATEAIKRLIGAYPEQLITLDELRSRMLELRNREAGLRQQIEALNAQLADREIYLTLADNVENFLTGLNNKAATTSIPERQRVLRLLVKDVLVSPDKITIRHSIPVRHKPTTTTNTHQEGESSANLPTALEESPPRCWPTSPCRCWRSTSPSSGRPTWPPGWNRARRPRHGLATYRVVRYADDFVVMVCGSRQHAEAIRVQIIPVLASVGLRLSEEKTTIAQLDEGFEFLGFRIQRQTKRGSHRRYVYTWVAKRSLTSIKTKVKTITRQGKNNPLKDLLRQLNPALLDAFHEVRLGTRS
jgi:hypothetical protein